MPAFPCKKDKRTAGRIMVFLKTGDFSFGKIQFFFQADGTNLAGSLIVQNMFINIRVIRTGAFFNKGEFLC